MSAIALTTDFGSSDWFVGAMKGVILSVHPQAAIVDVCHEIPPGDILAGAFALAVSCRFFPRNTVHVAVVDPGVGSSRPAIAVQTAEYFFVGPDNGILSLALDREKIKAIHRLENENFFLKPVSRTFHGRDVFAPVAACLSKGVSIRKLGPAQTTLNRVQWPPARVENDVLSGEVVYIDRFGNAITNISNDLLKLGSTLAVFLRGKMLCPLRDFYQAVAPGRPVAVPGSSGYLEIAINGGHAASEFKLDRATAISVRPASRK